jgi:hypothetical protein
MELFRQMFDNRAQQLERLARSVFPLGNNQLAPVTAEDLLRCRVVRAPAVNAQKRQPPLDVQPTAAQQLDAHRLAGR